MSCPLCGNKDAIQLLTSFRCPTSECNNYDEQFYTKDEETLKSFDDFGKEDVSSLITPVTGWISETYTAGSSTQITIDDSWVTAGTASSWVSSNYDIVAGDGTNSLYFDSSAGTFQIDSIETTQIEITETKEELSNLTDKISQLEKTIAQMSVAVKQLTEIISKLPRPS
jgi:hypothetical protein